MTTEIGNTIDLEKFRTVGAKLFTGRDRGKIIRENSHIDEIEEKFDEVNIIIPDNIYAINPSFFEEFFTNVVNKLGREGFLKKFKFENHSDYNYEKSLNEAIDRLLRRKTALD